MPESQERPQDPAEVQKKFLRALDELAKAVRGNAEATEDKAEQFEQLITHISHPDSGLIRTLDDCSAEFSALTQEIRALRKDLRDAARAGGLRNVFDRLIGG